MTNDLNPDNPLPPPGDGEPNFYVPPPVTPPRKRGKQARAATPEAPLGPAETPIAGTTKPKLTGTKIDQTKVKMATQLVGLHQLLAMSTGIAEFAINDIEAGMLAGPFVDVCVDFGIPLDGRGGSIVALLAGVGIVYGRRLPVISAKMRAMREGRSEAPQMPQAPPPPGAVVVGPPAPPTAGANGNGSWRPGMTVPVD